MTVCADGTWDERSKRSAYVGTFYYDPTPDGTFADPESLRDRNDPAVRVVGKDQAAPYDPTQGFVEPVQVEAVPVARADGSPAYVMGPVGARYWITWKDASNGLTEIWVFQQKWLHFLSQAGVTRWADASTRWS